MEPDESDIFDNVTDDGQAPNKALDDLQLGLEFDEQEPFQMPTQSQDNLSDLLSQPSMSSALLSSIGSTPTPSESVSQFLYKKRKKNPHQGKGNKDPSI